MQCPRCLGSGSCPDCQGKAFQECPACSGAGTRETSRGHSYPCRACSGDGTLVCPPKCSSCEGTGEITEELQKKVREIYTVKFSNFTPSGHVTRILMSLNISFFLAGMLAPNIKGAMLLGADVFSQHHYWELLSSNFQHANTLHLLANMSFLWTYGPVVEGLLGRVRYLGLYLGAGLVGSLLSWFGNCYLSGYSWAGVGASGSLFGLNGAMLAIYWRWRMLPGDVVRQVSSWAGIILLGGIAAELSGFRLLDNWGHAGGLLGGFIIAAALPRPRGH